MKVVAEPLNHGFRAPQRRLACSQRALEREDRRDLAVEFQHVDFRYPGDKEPALVDVSLDLRRGCRIALIGPNGAGKSTLLKGVAGLLKAEHGLIRVLGSSAESRHRAIAYVPQSREVDWSFPITVREVALMGRDVHLAWPRRPGAQDRERACRALDQVEMGDCAQRHISELSGGQKQRVFLARALAQEAELLLLDEPFAGVDAGTEALIVEIMRGLGEQGKTVIVATHDLTTVASRFDEVVLLHRRVVACGSSDEVLQPHWLGQAYGGPLALFEQCVNQKQCGEARGLGA